MVQNTQQQTLFVKRTTNIRNTTTNKQQTDYEAILSIKSKIISEDRYRFQLRENEWRKENEKNVKNSVRKCKKEEYESQMKM